MLSTATEGGCVILPKDVIHVYRRGGVEMCRTQTYRARSFEQATVRSQLRILHESFLACLQECTRLTPHERETCFSALGKMGAPQHKAP
jgi:hypothetical protein